MAEMKWTKEQQQVIDAGLEMKPHSTSTDGVSS